MVAEDWDTNSPTAKFAKVAEMANVSTHWVETVENEAGGRLSRFVSRMVSKPLVDRILKDERGYIDEEIYWTTWC